MKSKGILVAILATGLCIGAGRAAYATCSGGVPNGTVEGGEVCDDGNLLNNDNCLNDCSTPVCGDGLLHDKGNCSVTKSQQCSVQADCPSPQTCTIGTLEVCDDGNTVDTDSCNATCTSNNTCGNGVTDYNEQCDDGNSLFGDGCRGPGFGDECKTESCGNGRVDCIVGGPNPLSFNSCANGTEACDTSGQTAGCDADCTPAACGDGILNTYAGEQCDDGNTSATDACVSSSTIPTNCTIAYCGDGIVGNGEKCDDANSVNTDSCNNTCTSDNTCGNGVTDPGETCDDGNTAFGDGCRGPGCGSPCTVEACGNSIVDCISDLTGPCACTAEPCDSGGVNTVGCDANCTLPVCGDGTINTWAGESCDDLNTAGGDGCSASCAQEACGNGVSDVGEECDNGNAVCLTPNPFAASNGKECSTTAGKKACDTDNGRCWDKVSPPRCTLDNAICIPSATPPATSQGNCAPVQGVCAFGVAPGVVNIGNANSDYSADHCRVNCKVAFCGDRVADAGEQCDDGFGRGAPGVADQLDAADSCPNGAPAPFSVLNCKLPANSCGDGVPLLFDSSADCKNPYSGVSTGCLVNTIQQCDNGNPPYTLLKTCNNALTTPCSVDANCPPGGICGNQDLVPNACRTTCKPAGCGDDVTDTGETCDDGTAKCFAGTETGKACGTQAGYDACKAGNGGTPACGHSPTAADTNNGGDCYPTANACNANYTPGSCRTNCALATCGDGVVDPGEACDGGPNCTPTCTINVCGDGFTLGAETCDDGNTAFGDGCRGTGCGTECTIEKCGNGIIDCTAGLNGVCTCPVEACDQSNTINGDGCDTNCTVSGCGNGITAPNEECDDGNTANGDTCSSLCTNPACGDGLLASSEQCDDGNTASSDGCGIDCCIEVSGIGVGAPVSAYLAATECHLASIELELPPVSDIQEKKLQKYVDKAQEKIDQGVIRLQANQTACGQFKSASRKMQSFRKKVDKYALQGFLTTELQQQLDGKADAAIALLNQLLITLGC